MNIVVPNAERLASSPISVGISIFSVLFAFLCAVSETVHQTLALQPSGIFSSFRFWTLFTFVFAETSFLLFLANLACTLSLSVFLERIFRQTYLRFLFAVISSLGIVSFVLLILCYLASGDESFLFSGFGGFTGVSTALSVALKQQFPDQSLIEGVPLLRTMRYQHLPFIMILSSIFLFFMIPSNHTFFLFLQSLGGCILGWTYLRLYHKHPDTGAIGDSDDEFAFQTLLPKMFRSSPVHVIVQSDSESSLHELERDPAAERRRVLAIQMINEKLAERAQTSEQVV